MKYLLTLSFTLSILLVISCSKSLVTDETSTISQFGDYIIDFSTEYSKSPGPWSTLVALGEPDTYPEYGDIQTAWAPKKMDGGLEYLALGFDSAQYVNLIEVYETYNPGSITEVLVRNYETGSWVSVYSGSAEIDLVEVSRIKSFPIEITDFLVDGVKIIMDTKTVSGWNEIDAIFISGQK